MYEHTTLQEAYTGSLIAGKGKALPNIRGIMDRTRYKHADWARVRFGAGTPWMRCWCVVTPPDEKLVSKQQKHLKKRSAYENRNLPKLKGDVKFYDSKKVKKARLIATITDAYSAYAIYPQSKPLIDQSTLVKVEGVVTTYGPSSPSTSEGFVFVMPEAHDGLPGFEMMMRWLFPVFDTFALYGRPQALIADIRDPRGLMFAMPREKRYGYLEIIDVVSLINSEGSQRWTEGQWRKNMKELTVRRMNALSSDTSRTGSTAGSRRGLRNSVLTRSVVTFDDNNSTKSNPSIRQGYRPSQQESQLYNSMQSNTAPPTANGQPQPHQRSFSEAQGYGHNGLPPQPPPHMSGMNAPYGYLESNDVVNSRIATNGDTGFEDDNLPILGLQQSSSPEHVASPPAFTHRPGEVPSNLPRQSEELRKANSRISANTLALISGAGDVATAGAIAAWKSSQDQTRGPGERALGHDTYADGPIVDNLDYNSGASPIGYGGIREDTEISKIRNSVQSHPLPPPPPAEPIELDFDSRHYSRESSLAQPHNQSLQPQTAQHASSTLLGTANPPPGFDRPVGHSSGRYSYEKEHDQTQDRNSDHEIFAPPIPAKIPISEEQSPHKLPPLTTDSSITRKPVPGRTQSTKSNHVETPVTPSDSSSLRRHILDQVSQGALDQIFPRSESPQPMDRMDRMDRAERHDLRRQPSSDGSNYDNDTTASPDYASTRKSSETKRSTVSVEKPRAGVKRTVGSTDEDNEVVVVGDAQYKINSQQASGSSELIDIDFGRTYNYAAGPQGRPSTSGTLTQSIHDRSKSSGSRELYTSSSGNYSVLDGSPAGADDMKRRNSYGFPGKGSPGNHSREQSRPPSRNLTTPDPYRTSPSGIDTEGRRSMIWQPGTVLTGSPGRQGEKITPEQFVQQRAAQPQIRAISGHPHQRNQSTNSPGMMTPPQSRGSPGESPATPKARNSSVDYPPRPHSRGAFVPQGSGDYSTRLSAREREFVSKVTGSPLIDMAGGNSSQQAPAAGLVGAIEARQREKKEIKEGVSGQMVQHTILAQRQQQAQNSSYGQTSPNSQYGSMVPTGAMPQTQPPVLQQFNPQFGPGMGPQHARVYAQGGGWGNPQRPPQQEHQNPYFSGNQQVRGARN
jgi:CCR4-NOT transcriptional complex subunit CAF120